ncbi:hypothetical protein PLICRDRAFT_700571 [Plicaturopsis crispa FD-325 SS-3]|nr:hypothetical protein PLICRDRAFT_700571 [Plicaturopsis crispa FD-325 SS-3]
MDAEHLPAASVPFSFFASLLHEISTIKPKKSALNKGQPSSSLALQTLRRWISELHERFSPVPPSTAISIFRLLFPEEDARRKYDLQETRLAGTLARVFGVSGSTSRGRTLAQWNGEQASGCLGHEVRAMMEQANSDDCDRISELSIADVDSLLDELASKSSFSDHSIRRQCPPTNRPTRSRIKVLQELYHGLSPLEASFVTQIILKDLRPLLYPISETHYTIALNAYNTRSITALTKEDAMRAWDSTGNLQKIYRVRSRLDEAVKEFETGENSVPTPVLGTPIEIPKSVKGRGCSDALRHLGKSGLVWAETKYDGERAQIHLQVAVDGSSYITIFSKKKNESTMDRYAVHHIIRDALCLPHGAGISSSKVKKNIILDAEMVAFSDATQRVDEFWRIRSLVESTGRGPRASRFKRAPPQAPDAESQFSLASNASDCGTRHLALIFFDVLVLDDASLLDEAYSTRRSILESVIQPIPGYSMLAERVPITIKRDSGDDGSDELRRVFAQLIADHQEGAVLKANESAYNCWRLPWVKLKKDYIPGYGDTVDLVIVGAVWDKERARELRVAPTAFTTFYVGVLSNSDALKTNPNLRPHFEVYFTVAYGQDREQLEELNFLVKNSNPVDYSSSPSSPNLCYTFNMLPSLRRPTTMFSTPLVVELCGAGFTKAAASKYYELRFPRIVKYFRASERSWADTVPLHDLHSIARESVGRDRSHKDVTDWCNDLWGVPSSPGVKSALKRAAAADDWEAKLARLDKKPRRERGFAPDKQQGTAARTVAGTTLKEHPAPLGPRPALCPKPLGSVANAGAVMKVHSETRPRSQLVDSGKEDNRARPKALKGTAPAQSAAVPVSRIDGRSPPTPPTATKSRAPSTNAPSATPATVHDLLRTSLVWFARPHGSRCTPRRSMVPPGSRIHSLESFLAGCGWDSVCEGRNAAPAACQIVTWAERGVIFVDTTDATGDAWREQTLQLLDRRRLSARLTPRKAIWVCDSQMLVHQEEAGCVGRYALLKLD